MVEQRQQCDCAVVSIAAVFRESRCQTGNKTFSGVTALFNIVRGVFVYHHCKVRNYHCIIVEAS